jgi:mannosyltransferase
MAVSETDLGPEDPAAAVAAAPVRPVRPPAAAPDGRPWSRWLVIAVPVAVAAVTGGYEIGSPTLWRDEAYTKDAIGRSTGQLFALLGHQDAVHGAYYLLLHVIVGVIGTSATALRLPSLCAMVIATGFTAAAARRAAASGTASSALTSQLTGLLAGLLFATAPYMTYYAQMARSYALETMFATIATYLLLRAWPDGRWRWWAGYAVAVALTGLLNIFGLLILAAHGVTLLLAPVRGQAPAAAGRRIGPIPVRWLAAAVAAVAVLSPLLAVAGRQQRQIAWLARPNLKAIERLVSTTAGSRDLVLPFALLALAGLVTAVLADRWRPLNPAAVALPWLVVPPFLLIAASFVKPVYYVRYVEFCLPGLAIVAGAGLTGLITLAARTPLGRLRPAWAWTGLPALLVVAVLAALLAGPQQAIRQDAARPDNLRLASAIVAAHEQPGDAVFYIPLNMHVLGTGYPAPFDKLRNLAAGRSAIASATLTGTEITSPAELKSRFTDVRRVWVVTGASNYKFPVPGTRMDQEKMALIAAAGLRIIGRWQAGEVMLTLYGS